MGKNIHEAYIVGLIDGDGTIGIIRYPDGRVRPQVLIFSTYKDVLELIKKSLSLKAPILEVRRSHDNIKEIKILQTSNKS